MATLTVRDLDDDLVSRLRVQAARNNRSIEAEARAILLAALAVTGPPALGSRIRARFADIQGVESELQIPGRTDPPRVADHHD